jgi:hypothetical protein
VPKRISKLLLAISISLMIVSFNPGPVKDLEGPVAPEDYDGHFFSAISDMYLEFASADEKTVSIYLMTYENGYHALENASLDNVTWIMVIENCSFYSGFIEIPEKNWYVIIVVPEVNSTVAYNMKLYRVVPYTDTLLCGITILLFCSIIEYKMVVRTLKRLLIKKPDDTY